MLGRTLSGLRGFEFDYDVEKEHVFGAGSKPIDIQSGEEKPTGNIKVMKYEFDQLQDAAIAAGYTSILHVPHEAITITCVFKKRPTDKTRTITAVGVAFQKWTVGMEANAKMAEITLPFLAMDIISK